MEAVKLSVRGLVEFVLRCGSIDSRFSGFDRANEGSRIHRRLQKAAGKNYTAEVAMKAVRTVDGIEYRLDGRADGVIDEGEGGFVIDEIKTTAAPTQLLTADFNPLHWAQAKCYAAFLCADRSLAHAAVQLTYYQVDTGEIIRHRQAYSAAELEAFLLDTLHLYTPWAQMEADWRAVRNASIQSLRFPFAHYRAGQYELARAVYLTICRGERLFATAPTGVGKTISTLFPAVKALGEEKGERIFYLTAKTLTRQAAEEAVAAMRAACPADAPLRLKTITLTAKDKVCPLPQRICTPDACPRANGYYDRVNEALFRFLRAGDHFTREAILAFCEENALCPFELALDLTNWCDCIICDYNYLFDPVVSLKRFFTDGGDFIFLVDEAHNLVDRARDMYSASLSKAAFYSVKKQLGKTPRKLAAALSKVNSALIEVRHTAAGQPRGVLVPGGLAPLALLLTQFCAQAQPWLEEHREGALHDEMLALFFDVRFYLRLWEMYDEHFTTLAACHGQDVTVRLLCLDAAPFLDASMALGRASVLFSATLSPVDYFIATLGGGEGAKRIGVGSPFEPGHLCLLAADGVSTRYADRPHTSAEVCALIEAAVRARRGNYMVFLPSYQYLRDISGQFAQLCPDIPLAVQESGMDEAARENFLAGFAAQTQQTLVGFCVLGGIFAEGIDLAGERLIGSVIVGVGLPQIGPEQDALRDYYEAARGDGFAYAYQYPGMNKVLQAAGRVIRTPEDRGAVLLIDSRYASARYRRLFPPHWAHCRSVRSGEEVRSLLCAFWAQADAQRAPDTNAPGDA